MAPQDADGDDDDGLDDESRRPLLASGAAPPPAAGGGEGGGGGDESRGRGVMRTVSRRMLPLIFAYTLLASLCKTNVSYAASGLIASVHLTDEQYGAASSFFVLIYALSTIPTVLLAKRAGASRGLAAMIFGFGLVTAATAFVTNLAGFAASRGLLGVAEAGVLQTIYFQLSLFYPPSEYAYHAAISIGLGQNASDVLGGPLAALLMLAGERVGVEPWRFLFFVEALPCFAVGALVLALLPDEPAACGGLLGADGCGWLCERSARAQEEKQRRNPGGPESRGAPPTAAGALRRLLRDERVLIASFSGFFWSCGQWGLTFYLPLIIQDRGDRSAVAVALLSAVPYTFSAAAAVLTSWSSDRSRERAVHGSVGNFVAAAGLGATAAAMAGASPSPALQLAAITVAVVGSASSFPVRKAFEADILDREAAALGLAVMKTISLAGGIVGPAAVGALKAANGGSFVLPMAALAGSFTMSGLIFMLLLREGKGGGGSRAGREEVRAV